MPSASSSPPTGRIHAGPPVFDRFPSSTDPLPPVPRPEPLGAVVDEVVDAPPEPPADVVDVVEEPPPPPPEVVSVVATAVPVVDDEEDEDDADDVTDDEEEDDGADDDVVVAAAVSSLSSPRLPGFAMTRTAPITNSRAAATPRMVNLGFRTDSPRSLWSG